MSDTELLDFCDEAFKRNMPRVGRGFRDVEIGDISVTIGGNKNIMTFRGVIERAVQQRVDIVTRRLTK